MNIGLYDADFARYSNICFNLELMKLSTFYKNKKHLVSLAPDFIPERYSKMIYRQDYYNHKFDTTLLDKNVEYGGLAFTRNIYKPMDLDIEKSAPDVYIYERFRQRPFDTYSKEIFTNLMRSTHFRLSIDEKTVWTDFEKQIPDLSKSSTLFFHDYNLGLIEDVLYTINDLVKNTKKEKSVAFINCKFPVEVRDIDDFKNWSKLRLAQNFTFSFKGLKPDEVIAEIIDIERPRHTLRKIEYDVTAGCTEQEFINDKILKLFRQIMYLHQFQYEINLVYNPYFFQDKRWERLIDCWNTYLRSSARLEKNKFLQNVEFDSFYSFVYNLVENKIYYKHVFTRKELREIFFMVRQENYDLFKEFYECKKVKLKGGALVND